MSTYLENMLAQHSAPALLGIKASNLISCSLVDCPDLIDELAKLNKDFSPKHSFRILKKSDNRCLVLIYQNRKLYKTIFNKESYNYLVSNGYPKKRCLELYLNTLEDRIKKSESFPHEIGVFLGYDLFDTIEFQKGNKNAIYVGYWKVFNNKEEKLAIFDRFNRSKELIIKLLKKGYRLEELI